MVYTNNTPQATQTIALTQPLILGNFQFIEADLQVEHQFNGNVPGQAEGTHLKCSMPNRALSPAVPAGCNGVYFIASSSAFFYDGTRDWLLNPWQFVLTGTFSSTSAFTVISAVPANVQGVIYLGQQSGSGTSYGQVGTFITDGTRCYGYSSSMKIQTKSEQVVVELENSTASLNLRGTSSNSDFRVTYTYKIFYRPA